jgi:ArsR family transcriptional regulator
LSGRAALQSEWVGMSMKTGEAVQALAALAQQTRLEIFRLLANLLPEGLPATEIATTLGVAPTTLSFHLQQLTQAGLLVQRRESRKLIYSVDANGMRDLLGYLSDDCCHGRPELCRPAASLTCCEAE